MASFSPATRELVLKIVYYGPGLGGKTTTLKALHASVRAEHRGKMISLATPVDRTLYFDFLPVRLPSVGDVQLRLQLFTVPGQVYFNATRKLVLTGADGVVFVADSQAVRLDANIESLGNLRDNVVELGRSYEGTPIVLAYNKRDLPDVLSIDELDRELNPHGFPSLATSASTGAGVFESLDAVVRLALDDLVRRKTIPGDIAVPTDGIIAERLLDVREPNPAPVEPTRVVTGGGNSGTGTHAPLAPARPVTSPVQGPRGVVASAASVAGSIASAVVGAMSMPGAAGEGTSGGKAPTTLVPPALALGTPSVTSGGPVAAGSLSGAGGVNVPRLTPLQGLPRPPGVPQSFGGVGMSPTPSGAAAAMMRRGPTFVALFESEDQETVRTVEDALGEGIFPRAVLLVEALVVRLLERAAREMGRADAPPEAIAWALSLPPDRYARLRTAAQRARRGGEVGRRDALEAFMFAVQLQLGAEGANR